MTELHALDPNTWVETVWNALEAYRDLYPKAIKRTMSSGTTFALQWGGFQKLWVSKRI